MLAEAPYHFLLNLQELDCMADHRSRMAACSACSDVSLRSRTLPRNVLPLTGRATLGPPFLVCRAVPPIRARRPLWL